MQQTTATCPECGAPQQEGMNCWEQLGGIIAWEWQDPQLLAEHFLTVASYNLQHPAQFEERALQALGAACIAHLDDGMPVSDIRRHMGTLAEGATRVLKPADARTPILRRWHMTIADVYIPDHPENAADRVRAWAAAIRTEIQLRPLRNKKEEMTIHEP